MTESWSEFDQSLAAFHIDPSATTAAAPPFNAAELEAYGTALVDGILAQVLLAVSNITILGVKPFIGLQTWANQLEAQAQGALDSIATGATGTTQTGSTPASAAAALGGLHNTVTATAANLQAMQGSGTGGSAFTINFNQYPNGAWPSGDFPVTYSGTGTGGLEISGGNAVWNTVNNGNRTAISRYTSPTTTDYQTLNATIAGTPQGAAKNYACIRMNSAMDTYVYAGISVASFTLDWEIGCFISGVQHVFATGSGAPLNFTFELKAGVGGNPYHFQGISGTQVVIDYIDNGQNPGGTLGTPTSQMGSSYRYFGFKSITDNNGAYAPAPASYIGCFDDDPSTVTGSTFRQYNSISTAVSGTLTLGANPLSGVSTNFFDTVAHKTNDYANSGMAVTVANAGTYDVTMRIPISSANTVSGQWGLSPLVLKHGTADTIGAPTIMGNFATFQAYPPAFGGTVQVTCNAGDVLSPGYWVDGPGAASSLQFTGDGSGLECYWAISRANS